MRRLFWVAVGAAAAVVLSRRLTRAIDQHVPPSARAAGTAVSRLPAAVRRARADFTEAVVEREAQLRHGLLGDVDVEALRAERADRSGHGEAGTARPGPARRAGVRRADARMRRATRDFAGQPTEDVDDEDLPYAFF